MSCCCSSCRHLRAAARRHQACAKAFGHSVPAVPLVLASVTGHPQDQQGPPGGRVCVGRPGWETHSLTCAHQGWGGGSVRTLKHACWGLRTPLGRHVCLEEGKRDPTPGRAAQLPSLKRQSGSAGPGRQVAWTQTLGRRPWPRGSASFSKPCTHQPGVGREGQGHGLAPGDGADVVTTPARLLKGFFLSFLWTTMIGNTSGLPRETSPRPRSPTALPSEPRTACLSVSLFPYIYVTPSLPTEN